MGDLLFFTGCCKSCCRASAEVLGVYQLASCIFIFIKHSLMRASFWPVNFWPACRKERGGHRGRPHPQYTQKDNGQLNKLSIKFRQSFRVKAINLRDKVKCLARIRCWISSTHTHPSLGPLSIRFWPSVSGIVCLTVVK